VDLHRSGAGDGRSSASGLLSVTLAELAAPDRFINRVQQIWQSERFGEQLKSVLVSELHSLQWPPSVGAIG
jgi:hypothetical protein